MSKLEKIFLILQFFIWFVIFIGRYILMKTISPDLIPLLTKADINDNDLLSALEWGLIAQFYFLLFYFFISLFFKKRIIYNNNSCIGCFLIQKIILLCIIGIYILIFTKTKVTQSVLEEQGRLFSDLIFFHLPVYLSIYLVYKCFNKANIILSLLLSLLASFITGSKSYFIYTFLSIFIIYLIKFNSINRKFVILGSIFIIIFVNFMNIYRSSNKGENNFILNFSKMYISLFNRFNGLDYLSTVPENFNYSFNRFLYWPLAFVPRKFYNDKPIFSASLLLNKKFNPQVGNMLVSYTFIVGIRNILLIIFNMLVLAFLFKILINISIFRVAFIYNLFFLSSFWEQDIFTFYTYGMFKILFLSFIGMIFFKLNFKRR